MKKAASPRRAAAVAAAGAAVAEAATPGDRSGVRHHKPRPRSWHCPASARGVVALLSERRWQPLARGGGQRRRGGGAGAAVAGLGAADAAVKRLQTKTEWSYGGQAKTDSDSGVKRWSNEERAVKEWSNKHRVVQDGDAVGDGTPAVGVFIMETVK